MENEGIMALPSDAAMSGEAPQNQPITVTSADSYDAALTAYESTSPGGRAALQQSIRENIGDLQLTPQQMDLMIQMFEYVSQNPTEYQNLVQVAVEEGILDEGDLPPEYDPEFIGIMLAVLQEMRMMQGASAQQAMDLGPVIQGLQPMGMAQGGLADVGQYLAGMGRGGDSILAHITPEEAELLKSRGGAGTTNPSTGLPEFKGNPVKAIGKVVKGTIKSVTNVAKKIVKSPIGRVLATVALAVVLGPAGVGLSMGTAAGLAGAGTTLLGGGSVKDALIAGAMGYVGGGGTIMGTSPVTALGGYLPGAAGSALNTGLTTGVLGAGIGKLGGMSTKDALRMGLMSGATAAALTGLQDTSFGRTPQEQAMRDDVFRRAAAGDQAAIDMVNSGNYGPAPTAAATTGTDASGAVPTAKDLLASGQNADGGLRMLGSTSPADGSLRLPNSISPADGSLRLPNSISPASGAPPSGYGINADYSFTSAPGGAGAGFRAGGSGMGPSAPISSTVGAGGAPNYSLGAAEAPGFFSKMATGTKNLFNEYLSPSRPGLAPDAGILTKYGPLALAGTAATYAMGGMEGDPARQNPAFDRNYTGVDYIRDNADRFSGGLSRYTRPDVPPSPVVKTIDYSTRPVSRPTSVIPTGITNQPGGVAQPYNVSGLYGVPLIYGPDGQPVRQAAKGGSMTRTKFPRRTGPINGPGTGTSDDIPAMLSDGEFVFTAKAVRNAGDGSRRKGAARMYRLMKKLEGGAVKGK
jgi:hypothetical protein